jgi:cytochrome c nitrite reductase small subunit
MKGFLILSILIGALAGVGVFTLLYAEGLSYLSNDPAACANCHIMWPQYEGWQKSSHHTVATCVDCHLPDDFVGKYTAKAVNGYHHSKGFTFQDFQEPIQIKGGNARILQESCLRCHESLAGDLAVAHGGPNQELRCVRCHATVGHGDQVSIGGPQREHEIASEPRIKQ